MNTSKYISSQVSSLNLRTETGHLKINNTAEPFVITLENQPEKLESKNITMYMPGKTKVKSVKLDSMNCNLIISIHPLNDFKNKTKLHVLVQYGKPPTQQEHDVKLTISNEAPASFIQSTGFVNISAAANNTNTTTLNATTTLQRSSYIRLLEGNSFLLWNFTEFTYGHINNSNVYLSLYYDGPMPDLVHKENRYTYDVLDERGSFNYSLKSFCADCSYWDEEKSMWSKDGCEVSVPVRR